jgi:UDP-N-acetyl-D-mannosaminuronic acid dehydrogenase
MVNKEYFGGGKSISVIGLGFVGLTLAVVLAKSGFMVHGVEINPEILKKLKTKKAHFFEPGLNYLLEELVNKNLFFHESLPDNEHYLAHIISVGTPLKSDGLPNFEHLTAALEVIKEKYTGNELVILRSTVSVGVTRSVVCPLLLEYGNVLEQDLRVAFCPERTIEGNAIEELSALPQVVSGLNQESLILATNIFKKITNNIVKVESLEAGELVKLFNNTYRDIHFSLGNCFNMIAQSFGVNGIDVINAANFCYARSQIPLPGFVGGPCLEKDAYILINSYKNPHNSEVDFVIGARKYNESLVDNVNDWVARHRIGLGDKPLVISGLAFKGQPATSDLRGSTALSIALKIKEMGIDVRLHDYCVPKEDLTSLKIGEVYDNLQEACNCAGGILILNNHLDYQKEDYNNIIKSMIRTPIFFDAWQASKYESNQDSIIYAHLGNFQLVQAHEI